MKIIRTFAPALYIAATTVHHTIATNDKNPRRTLLPHFRISVFIRNGHLYGPDDT